MSDKRGGEAIFQAAKGVVLHMCKAILKYIRLYIAFIKQTAAQKGYAVALLYLAPTLGIVA